MSDPGARGSCGVYLYAEVNRTEDGTIDLRSKICHGDVPQIIMVQIPQGIQLRSVWPTVDAQLGWCRRFAINPKALT